MRKLGAKIAFLLLLALFAPLFGADKQVLILNSYHRGFQWSDDVIKGVEEVLGKDVSINVNILYMDSKRISSQNYYKKLLELYQIQLKNRKYDLVIALDRFAYDFVLEYYHKLFTNEPVLFSGLEQSSLEEIKKRNLSDKIYGVYENRAISDNIKIISKMMPNLEKLYIINDQSKNGDDSEMFIRKAMKENNENFDIEYIRASTLQDIEQKFSRQNKNEAIFFVRFYNDQNGNFYRNNQIAQTLNRLKVPVFITDTLFIGKGAVGGKLVPIERLGILTGEVAIQILNHEVKPLYTVTLEDYEYEFDINKLNEFALNPEFALKNYEVVNAPKDFFERHKEFINFVFIISPLLLLLILGLLHNIYMRIKNERKLRAVELEKAKHQQFVIQQSKLAEIGEIFSSIAHQWKSPLVEIATIAQEQAMGKGIVKNRDEYVKAIMTQVQYMTDTIESFQDFIKPSNEKTNFDVYDSVKTMLKIVDHTIKYNYIDIVIDAQNANNFIVKGYKNEFMQTLLNIVNNAKDAIREAKKDHKIKRGRISFEIYNLGKDIIMNIEDNGGGIKHDILPHIFDPYMTTKPNGHGIGLYMTKIIIEDKMGGNIRAFNVKGGACFSIRLRSV